jgi:hypothetical protein
MATTDRIVSQAARSREAMYAAAAEPTGAMAPDAYTLKRNSTTSPSAIT